MYQTEIANLDNQIIFSRFILHTELNQIKREKKTITLIWHIKAKNYYLSSFDFVWSDTNYNIIGMSKVLDFCFFYLIGNIRLRN